MVLQTSRHEMLVSLYPINAALEKIFVHYSYEGMIHKLPLSAIRFIEHSDLNDLK